MAKTPTHEPCGNGHQRPIGQDCAACAQLQSRADAKRDRELARNEEALRRIKEQQERDQREREQRG